MVVDDHESVLVPTDRLVLFESQVDAPQTHVVHALAQKWDGFTASRGLEGLSHAFVSDPEGPLVFSKAHIPRVQGNVKYPYLRRVND